MYLFDKGIFLPRVLNICVPLNGDSWASLILHLVYSLLGSCSRSAYRSNQSEIKLFRKAAFSPNYEFSPKGPNDVENEHSEHKFCGSAGPLRSAAGALLPAWGPVRPPPSPMPNVGPDTDDNACLFLIYTWSFRTREFNTPNQNAVPQARICVRSFVRPCRSPLPIGTFSTRSKK